MTRIFINLIVILILGNLSVYAQKDSLFMKNKESLIGEIKSYQEGVLIIETAYSDKDFQVEWDQIAIIRTEQKFLVLTSDGDRFFGRIMSTKEDPSIVMVMDEKAGNPTITLEEIVFFKEIDDKFWDRLDLKLSAGYTLQKANESHQLSGNLATGYLTNRFNYSLNLGIIRTIQTSDDVTTEVSRTSGGIGVIAFLVKDWFGAVSSDLLQSSEQKLDLRAITKAGVGHYSIKTNKMNLGLMVGMAWNYENYDNLQDQNRNSTEAFFGAQYRIFNMGDFELDTTIAAYPSLTESKRFRTDFNFNLEYEFSFDLFFSVGLVFNYDNKPSLGATTSDYVLTTSIGWEL